MNRLALFVSSVWGPASLAQVSPPTLVGVPGENSPSTSWFELLGPWPLLILGFGLIVLVGWFLKNRFVRPVGPKGALSALCHGLGLSASERRTLVVLARSHGSASASSLLLCPSAFDCAAARAGSGIDREMVQRLRRKLA